MKADCLEDDCIDISKLKINDKAIIIGYKEGELRCKHQLMIMGLLPQTVIELKQIGPLGDPVKILVRGISIALRKREIAGLKLKPITKIKDEK